jgi:capsular exopolysaccharide synthesis family protein
MGLPSGARNIQNQIIVVKSRTLTERTLNLLPFEVDFFFKTLRNRLPIYPDVPIKISLVKGDDLPRNIEFSFKYLGGNAFQLESSPRKRLLLPQKSFFGDTIQLSQGSIRIENGDNAWLNENKEKEFHFVIHDKMGLVRDYNDRLKVEAVSREGTTLKISIEGTNRAKDVDYINKLTEIFVSLSLDKKNLEAARRIQFIDDQLVDISDSLVITENRLQQFRSRNRIMDLSSQGQAIIAQSVELENQRARIAVETNYYNYLSEYLEKDLTKEAVVAPATMGITDPGLTRLVAELASLQAQFSSGSLGEMNPLQNQLIQRIKNTKEALQETLNGLKRANSIAVEENLSQIRKLNNQAAALPGTERQLLGIERKFRLNDELYTFLLERRAEQQMQKASNVADDEVIDYAHELASELVSPNRPVVYLISWFFSLLIPAILIILSDFLNKTIRFEDLERISYLPIAGKIPKSTIKISTVVFEIPESPVAEAFRLVRSKMQFFTKEAKSPVILITSALPGDGKTFTAINLASVYSLLGKRTVLIGFDLRKPKIYNDFNLSNDSGISTYLIGKDKLLDVIRPTDYENLFVIPSGPIPPNPSELTALPKTEELINSLKKHFDCIIIDSSPIGIVSDTYYLASLADLCSVIVRYEKTLKIALEKTVNELKLSGIKSVSLIINDLPLDSRNYGYGGKYGYTKSTEPGSNTTKLLKKKILQRSKLGKNRQKVVSTETPWHSKI